MRILYIVTSSKEYNTGEKATKYGQDRLFDIVVPVLMESVESIQQSYHNIDVYLILGYTLSDERYTLIQNLLPINVGLEIWNDATPIHYDYITSKQKQVYMTQRDKLLARQHRYVIKDKLPYYDFFVVYEDDMLIKEHHIQYYLQFNNEINKYKRGLLLAEQQQEDKTSLSSNDIDNDEFWGSLTMKQLDHIKPGFIRVEVIKNHTEFDKDGVVDRGHSVAASTAIDPSLCCHSKYIGHQGRLVPQYPTSNDIVIWETSIDGMHIKQMPKRLELKQSQSKSSLPLLDWVVVLPIKGEPLSMSAYWSGNVPDLTPSSSSSSSSASSATKIKKKPPPSLLNEYISQSASWMATSNEILDYNYKLCKGTSSFIPPFDGYHVAEDGYTHVTDSVEFWSGSLQLYGQQCSIQRLVAIDTDNFSKHLIYHTANNKQIELPNTRFTKVKTLYEQLQRVVKQAKKYKRTKLRNQSWWNYFFYFLF